MRRKGEPDRHSLELNLLLPLSRLFPFEGDSSIMDTMETIDACGLSCPEPALRVKEALRSLDKGTLHVRVDSSSARDNVVRIAIKAGWQVSIEGQPNGVFRISLTK
jgi:tRNA 2-thiouridine synthesizing protein A